MTFTQPGEGNHERIEVRQNSKISSSMLESISWHKCQDSWKLWEHESNGFGANFLIEQINTNTFPWISRYSTFDIRIFYNLPNFRRYSITILSLYFSKSQELFIFEFLHPSEANEKEKERGGRVARNDGCLEGVLNCGDTKGGGREMERRAARRRDTVYFSVPHR